MSFVFYDFETSGTSPAFDQPIQFAAILTDEDLVPLERVDIRCKLAPHILPAPWAMAVTGVDPELLTDPSLPSWFEFVQRLSNLIDRWGPSTWTGYNSIAFDEEMLRQSFYQNLHPNLYRTQMNGNDRLDIMKVVYAAWELAPDTLNWPVDDRGRNSFKLDQLAPANGFEHHDAHDALGDVEATIHIARLIRDRAPEVWKQSQRNKSKQKVNALLESGHALRLVERFGAAAPRSYLGAFCGRSQNNPNSVGFLDLGLVNPADFAGASDEEIAAAVSDTPKVIRTITVNKCPSLFEAPDVDGQTLVKAETLAHMNDFHQKVSQALTNRWADKDEPKHLEQKIYSGFFSSNDKLKLEKFQVSSWEDRASTIGEFEDQRLRLLGQRLIYLYRPDLLDTNTKNRIAAGALDRWMSSLPNSPWMTFARVEIQLAEIEAAGAINPDAMSTLRNHYTRLKSV